MVKKFFFFSLLKYLQDYFANQLSFEIFASKIIVVILLAKITNDTHNQYNYRCKIRT